MESTEKRLSGWRVRKNTCPNQVKESVVHVNVIFHSIRRNEFSSSVFATQNASCNPNRKQRTVSDIALEIMIGWSFFWIFRRVRLFRPSSRPVAPKPPLCGYDINMCDRWYIRHMHPIHIRVICSVVQHRPWSLGCLLLQRNSDRQVIFVMTCFYVVLHTQNAHAARCRGCVGFLTSLVIGATELRFLNLCTYVQMVIRNYRPLVFLTYLQKPVLRDE